MNTTLHQHAHAVLRAALAPILPWLDDERVSEVMVNRHDSIWFEREGALDRVPAVLSESALRSAIRLVASMAGRDAHGRGEGAIVEARVSDMRVAAAFPPVSLGGISLCVRKHSRRGVALSDYEPGPHAGGREAPGARARPDPACRGSLLGLLQSAVVARENMLVSGATSSGKTTFLNALLAAVPVGERVVTVEDTAELCVPLPNRVGFETDPSSGTGLRELVRLALRYRPDRIVVGEVRGAEAFDLLQALSTGHDGGFATIHAAGATQALDRLEQLVLASGIAWPAAAVRAHIATTFDRVVHLARVGGERRVAEIVAIKGVSERGWLTESVYRDESASIVPAGRRS